MEFLDMRTILVSYVILNLICTIVLVNLWHQNRSLFKGLDLCMMSFGVNLVGVILLGLRGIVPDFVSIIFGNILLVTSVLFLYIGVARFFNVKIWMTPNWILLFVYSGLQLFFTYGYADLRSREILFSAVLTIYCLQMTWTLFSFKDKRLINVTRGLGVVSILYWVIGIIRIVYHLSVPPNNDLFSGSLFTNVLYLAFEAFYIILTFYLYLLVNRSLIKDLEDDITVRKIIEKKLQVSEEKFSKAFLSSPTAVILSRVADGKILEINQAFLKLSGYTREELASKSTLDLGMWDNPEERSKIIRLIEKKGRIDEFEFIGKTKSGIKLRLLFSGDGIVVNNEKCLIVALQDITERVVNEKVIRMRLDLWEYAIDHSIIELMTRVLDELEELTDSRIGFFHFIEKKQTELVLQAWSTRTKREFCKAEGENAHYALDKAGVWADAVRLKKPVIHNDYASIPEKKGMPEGHAVVHRELVVPIINRGKVEAVLGVGNKETNYETRDIELVEEVATLVWIIVQQKQADDQVMQLNEQLHELAMVDELTKIFNRRAFIIRANEEISRTRRYHLPLSMVMMDIDNFKKINDTFGHDSGDFVLQCVAATLKQHIRDVDVLGRLGGEEFGLILPNTRAKDAAILAERLREKLYENQNIKKVIKRNITTSFGVAEYELAFITLEELMRVSDVALYLAKNNGRNRVETYQPIE